MGADLPEGTYNRGFRRPSQVQETPMVLVRRVLVTLVMLGAGLVLAIVPAAATTFDDVGQALRADSLYQDPQAEVQLNSLRAAGCAGRHRRRGDPDVRRRVAASGAQ